ncbi:uroporphyrinogen-III C-methyltransferase [Staphylospora marina]|uniref:uroporphyrinogen-III C-methyltransferase n=1 Tax=Staphylospora marina TaxID=2490858 RepID=UPI000F5C0A07|nr:uroporphyrinogen-III C-methyltransferase [Staphylospora marina]
MNGKVVLVGAGPGDPGLMTVKGLEVIQKADVIVYDRLTSPLLLKHKNPGAELVYVGELPDRHALTQEEIHELLVQKAKEGKFVCRLKGDDPFFFGRGGEEAERCVEEGIPYEVVPGVTSAVAVPAYAGIPVTHRDFNASFVVIAGQDRAEKAETSVRWDLIAAAHDTLVFPMEVGNLPYITEQLIKHGKSPETPVALICRGTRVEQETLTGTLADIAEKMRQTDFRSPAVIVVGEVVKLREKLAWFEKKPLFGKRILVTRARSQMSVLSEKIRELGGEPLEFPVIRITSPARQDLLDQALRCLGSYDWVIFTSANGVRRFFLRLRELGIDIRSMHKAKVAAIGPKTAEPLLERGIQVELLPDEYRAESLVEVLRPHVKPGERILLPRADIARKVLSEELAALGCEVTEVDAYDTRMNAENAGEVVKLLKEEAIHVITFTSPSTVRNFLKAVGTLEPDVHSLLARPSIVCIGPVTAKAAEEEGLNVDAVADDYTIDGLLDAVRKLPAGGK